MKGRRERGEEKRERKEWREGRDGREGGERDGDTWKRNMIPTAMATSNVYVQAYASINTIVVTLAICGHENK